MSRSLPSALIATIFLSISTATRATPVQVFYTDFNSGVPAEITGVTTLDSVQGLAGLGPSGNTFSGMLLHNATGALGLAGSPTILTLTDLPEHTAIDLDFLLATLNTWDGETDDYFNVVVDGQTVFRETFVLGKSGQASQSYQPPPGVQLTPRDIFNHFPNAGFGNTYGDGAYNMAADPRFDSIPHTASTLTIMFFADGPGWEGGTNESWAIDNLRVTVHNNEVVPEPSGGLLMIAALAGLMRKRR